jgi:hypothetical protein
MGTHSDAADVAVTVRLAPRAHCFRLKNVTRGKLRPFPSADVPIATRHDNGADLCRRGHGDSVPQLAAHKPTSRVSLRGLYTQRAQQLRPRSLLPDMRFFLSVRPSTVTTMFLWHTQQAVLAEMSSSSFAAPGRQQICQC